MGRCPVRWNACAKGYSDILQLGQCLRCGGCLNREEEAHHDTMLVYDRCLNCGEYYELGAYPTIKVSDSVSKKIHLTWTA